MGRGYDNSSSRGSRHGLQTGNTLSILVWSWIQHNTMLARWRWDSLLLVCGEMGQVLHRMANPAVQYTIEVVPSQSFSDILSCLFRDNFVGHPKYDDTSRQCYISKIACIVGSIASTASGNLLPRAQKLIVWFNSHRGMDTRCQDRKVCRVVLGVRLQYHATKCRVESSSSRRHIHNVSRLA